MPRRPPRQNQAPGHDARLDPFRERAATLSQDGQARATVFIRVETARTVTSGHLWWRRWSKPFEQAHGYMVFVDGGFDDWIVGPAGLNQDLTDWSRHEFRYVGEVLNLEWLDESESEHLRDQVFGLDAPST